MTDNNKYSALCCYFGKWPNYFQLWLNSCGHNGFITFFMVTDISVDGFEIPPNVHIVNRTFVDVQRLIHNTFDEEIKEYNGKCASIERPYKLCEYKTAYGWLFRDLFQGYDYWGYYDIDLIWGDLVKFFPENDNNTYVKIFPCGHLSFIKNIMPYDRIFSLVNDIIGKYDEGQYHGYKLMKWQDAFSVDDSMFYDEEGGLEPLMNILKCEKNLAVYSKVSFDNILPPWTFDHFECINNPGLKNIVYSYDDGCIYRHWLSGFKHEKCEISYLHISKRMFSVKLENKINRYIIYPNSFASYRPLTLLSLLFYGRMRRMKNFYKRLIRKFL